MTRPLAPRSIDLACGALAAVALAGYLLVALVHLGDNYHVDHVTGAWMGLTAYADDGVLYPPLYDGEVFGGTRYAPLGIALNTAAAKIGGEYLTSGKLVALLVMLGIAALVYVIARDHGCARGIAFAGAGGALATFTALFAGTTIYGDSLAVLLQLGAIAVVARRSDAGPAAAAGVLAGLALTAKVSALWGGAAVAIWLIVHRRRSLIPFLAAGATTLLVGFGLAALVSDGRIGENLIGLGGSGFEGIGQLVSDTPSKIFTLARENAEGTLLLLPFAIAVLAYAALRRRMGLPEIALAVALGVTLVVMTDVGTGFNHLLDLTVLVPLAVVSAHGRVRDSAPGLLLAGALAASILISLVTIRGEVREAAESVLDGETRPELETPAFGAQLEGPYFSEDPTIPVERDEVPVALDTFMLLRVLDEHPEWESDLVERFERHEFTTVVLIADLDLSDPWWSESHLGLEIARAIDRNYKQTGEIPGPTFRYRILTPIGQPRSGGAGGLADRPPHAIAPDSSDPWLEPRRRDL